MDDLGVKYIDKADADHIFSAIEEKYPLKIDWEANTYLGINFEWNYDEGYAILSMEGYIEKAMKEYPWIKPENKYIHHPNTPDLSMDKNYSIQMWIFPQN